jgi:lysophospholipase L1-like esterase
MLKIIAVAAAAALPAGFVAGCGSRARGEDPAVVARSLAALGDTARLEHVLAKARRGESVTVAVIGGSITASQGASGLGHSYAHLMCHWWRDAFPQTPIHFVNAGISATTSNYGALRAPRDLLPYHPDFVIVEFGVNDKDTRESAESVEGLVRQILGQPSAPAVVLLFFMHKDGSNAQAWQGRVGEHYGLPMVSFRDAFWPEIAAGKLRYDDVEADSVHPNNRGHAAAAQFIAHLLTRVRRDLPTDSRLAPIPPLPAPLLSDDYAHVALLEAEALTPTRNEGWTFDAAHHCWTSATPGSVVEFAISGTRILGMDWHKNGPMGMAAMGVDDLPAAVCDGWYEQAWGGYRGTIELARGLPPGPHRVRITLLAQTNPESDGHSFRIMGLGAAGVH